MLGQLRVVVLLKVRDQDVSPFSRKCDRHRSADTEVRIRNDRCFAGKSEGEQVLPLSEEQLDVGKRTVDRGTTRVRRYVVEKPAEENVTLRGERVTVERRQPLETTATPGTGAFEERVVEVRETAEEPVVARQPAWPKKSWSVGR